MLSATLAGCAPTNFQRKHFARRSLGLSKTFAGCVGLGARRDWYLALQTANWNRSEEAAESILLARDGRRQYARSMTCPIYNRTNTQLQSRSRTVPDRFRKIPT